MRLLLIAIYLMTQIGIQAQEPKTIFTNEKDAVALFFPNAIRQALTGSQNFTFSYNRDNPQHVGVVQGNRSNQSNLLVITENGNVFSYRLAYRKVLDTLNYFVTGSERIGNEVPVQISSRIDSVSKAGLTLTSNPRKTDSLRYRSEHFIKISSHHLKHNKMRLKTSRKQGIIIRLKNLNYDRTEVYALIEIKNRSGIDFEVDYLKVFKVHGNNRRKSSFQKIPLAIVHKENFPKLIKDRGKASFVLVLPKFTLGDSEKLMLELKEFRGSRNIRLFYR